MHRWQPSDGGCLRIFDGQSATDIEPLPGRLVVFNSALKHEVRPVWHHRYALTLWIWREDGDEEKLSMS